MPIGKKVDERMELALEKSMSILVVGVAAEPILQKENKEESSSQGGRIDWCNSNWTDWWAPTRLKVQLRMMIPRGSTQLNTKS